MDNYDKYLATVPEIELEKFRYNSINYEYASVDNDYVNWKYKFPNTNDILIIFNDDIMSTKKLYDSNDEHYIYDSIYFVISDWKNIKNNVYAKQYFFSVLAFTNDTKMSDILDCVRHFVISNAEYNFKTINDDQIFTNNIIDYTKIIKINLETYMIYNPLNY